MEKEILEAKGVGVAFNGNMVLRDISFTLERGQTIALVGPNGAGKSVLLRTLLGFIPHTGIIEWAPKIRAAYIPQLLTAERDLPLTVAELFKLQHISHEVMVEHLQHVGLEPRNIEYMPVGRLSGGQFQRVMIAWAIAQEPDVLFFDEPTAGVDLAGQESVYELVRHIQKEHGIAIILVSHDIGIVYRYADRVICLNHTMTCNGIPQEALTPEVLERLYGPMGGAYEHNEHHAH